jgi:hypothetical protein
MKDLPQGLHATFIRCLTKIHAHSSRDRLRRALRWVVCATRPLTLAELADAVAIEEMQDSWDVEKVVSNPETIVDDCANLLVIPTRYQNRPVVESHVKLIHDSVRDFLISNPNLSENLLRQYHVHPLQDAHTDLARQCFKYFTSFSNQTGLWAFRGYAVTGWTMHVNSSGTPTQVLEELIQTSIVAHPSDLVDLYPNVTHMTAKNCTFIVTPGNQYNVFLNCDPGTDYGRFSYTDLLPQLAIHGLFNGCTFIDCDFSANVYDGEISPHPGTAKISFDPHASHIFFENFVFNHVRGTQYDIFPFHHAIIAKKCNRDDVGLLTNATGPITVDGGRFDTIIGSNYHINGTISYKLFISPG